MMEKIFYILFVVGVSCKSMPITSDKFLKPEIESYGLQNGDTLVDIGCGDGTHAAYISKFYPLSYFILEDIDKDVNKRVYELYENNRKLSSNIRELYQVVKGTSDVIPLPSSTYNYLLCRKTFHEFTDIDVMIKEINRVLKIGGRLIIVEAQPLKKNERDPDCGRILVPEDEIVSRIQMSEFVLIKSNNVLLKKGRRLVVLIFEKKPRSIQQ